MVDRISNQSIQDTSLLNIGQAAPAERTKEGKKTASADLAEGFDKASISDEAMKAWSQEKEMLKFSRLAQRDTPEVDYEKVNRIKNLVDNGRIADYLSTVDTNALVESMLSGPVAVLLK